jgi:PKD repeat protein
MKSFIPKPKNLFLALVLIISMAWSKQTQACTANFTYTYGPNGQVNFSATYSGYNNTPWFWWDAGDANPYMWGQNVSHQYASNGTYTVTLIAYDSTCTDTVKIPVTVSNVYFNCNMTASFSTTFGNNGQVTFTSTSLGTYPWTKYYWKAGDSNKIDSGVNMTTFVHNYDSNGYYKVQLYLGDSNICYSNVYDTTIYVYNAPVACTANFTYTYGSFGLVNFAATYSNFAQPPYFSWTFGDGNYGSGQNPSNTYASNGTYTVTLVTFDVDSNVNGCIDTIQQVITINNACNLVASFTAQKDSNGQETFTSTSQGAQNWTMYYWDPGDGSGVDSAVNMTTFVHTYPFIGYYIPTLYLGDSNRCYSPITTDTIYIRNRDSLWACFTWIADSSTPGKYDFTSCSKGTNAFTYLKWNPGDGSPADSGIGMNSYTHVYNINGPYNATLTIWYTQIPHRAQRFGSPHYSEESVTNVVHVNTVNGIAPVQEAQGELKVYPSPNNGYFVVDLTNLPQQTGKVEMEISNLLGQTVDKTEYTVNSGKLHQPVNMQNSPSGIYFIRITTGSSAFTSKIVLQK